MHSQCPTHLGNCSSNSQAMLRHCKQVLVFRERIGNETTRIVSEYPGELHQWLAVWQAFAVWQEASRSLLPWPEMPRRLLPIASEDAIPFALARNAPPPAAFGKPDTLCPGQKCPPPAAYCTGSPDTLCPGRPGQRCPGASNEGNVVHPIRKPDTILSRSALLPAFYCTGRPDTLCPGQKCSTVLPITSEDAIPFALTGCWIT
jgi:hypothetical protein